MILIDNKHNDISSSMIKNTYSQLLCKNAEPDWIDNSQCILHHQVDYYERNEHVDKQRNDLAITAIMIMLEL